MTTETKPAIHLEDWPVKAIPEDLAILMRVRERLSNPENWCQGSLINGFGAACLVGSIALESGWNGSHETIVAYVNSARLAEKRLRLGIMGGVIEFNDTRTYAEVLALLDKAIKEGLTE